MLPLHLLLSSLAIATLTLANHNILLIPDVPSCALSCGASQCDSSFSCCPCFEYKKLSPNKRNIIPPTTTYQRCILDSCADYEIETLTHYLGHLASSSAFPPCQDCKFYDLEKTWEENEKMREDEERAYDLKVGLSVALPLLAVLVAVWCGYWYWLKPRRAQRKQGKVYNETEDIELEDKHVPEIDWRTGGKSLPLG